MEFTVKKILAGMSFFQSVKAFIFRWHMLSLTHLHWLLGRHLWKQTCQNQSLLTQGFCSLQMIELLLAYDHCSQWGCLSGSCLHTVHVASLLWSTVFTYPNLRSGTSGKQLAAASPALLWATSPYQPGAGGGYAVVYLVPVRGQLLQLSYKQRYFPLQVGN